MDEKWVEIEGYNGDYLLSNRGHIISLKRGMGVLKSSMTKGYIKYGLCKDSKMVNHELHRLLALHFILNPNNKPNNDLLNLEWNTSFENMTHAFANGLICLPKGEKHHNCKLSDKDILIIKKMLKNKVKQLIIAQKFNVSQSTITYVKNSRAK